MGSTHSHSGITDPPAANRRYLVILGLALIALALAGFAPVNAQSPAGAAAGQLAPALAPTTGGPDEFGYTYVNSLDPGGPPYVWDEIAGVGTLVDGGALAYVGYAGPLPIGFPFDYYGAAFSNVYISRNGYISFGQGYGEDPSYNTIPSASPPNNAVAIFGSNLMMADYGTNSRVYYATLASPQRLVVEYVNVYRCCSPVNPMTFQVVLYPGGDIEVRYKQLNGQTTTYAGIENATGTDGLLYTGGLANNLAVRYRYPVGVFLTPSTLANIGAPGTTITFSLTVTNRTGSSENFDLSLEPGHAWPATLSMAQTGPLAANASLDFDVLVDVPAGASSGDTDLVTVRARSVSAPAIYDTSVLTATASNGQIAAVTLSDNDLVALVDSDLHTLLGVVNVGAAGCDFPWRAAKTPSGSQVYVSCDDSNSVVVIDLASRSVVHHITGIYRADGIAFSNDGASAFVGSRTGGSTAISRINTQTYAVNSISHGYATRSIAAHPFLNLAYVTSGDGTILVLDTQAFAIVDTIPVTGEPWDVAVSPDGQWAYTGDRRSPVISVIDVQTHAVHTTAGALNVVTGLDVSPDGSTLYAAGLSNGVQAIDTTSLQVVGTVYTSGNAWEVAATCQGDEVWVGNVTDDVVVLDAASFTLAAPIPMPGWGTREIAICPQVVTQGVILSPAAQTRSGGLGEPVAHEITLVNATGQSDSFQLSLGASQWPATLASTTIGPLANGETATVTVTVTVPLGAQWYATDTVEVTAVAVGQPAVSDTASLTTQAYAPPVASVQPASLSVTQLVNQTSDQTLTISNGNGVTLTVDISDVADIPADLGPHVVASASFTTTVDNEDNGHTGSPDYDMDVGICDTDPNFPVEFNIFVDIVPTATGNTLAIRAYNVDYPYEIVPVRLNGQYLGQLQGNPYQWVITTFELPSGALHSGANLVEVTGVYSPTCFEVDWGAVSVADPPADWLHENPTSLEVPANESRDVTVTFDAGGQQPGLYQAIVVLATNDPAQSLISVPASMTVNPTADMGRVAGAVSDAWTGLPLTATVELVGIHTTTARPAYEIWAPAGAYSLVASATGYVSVTTPVAITAGQVVAQDIALELNQPRLQWSPGAVSASAAPGGLTTATLSVINAGPAQMNAAFFEINPVEALAAPAPQDLTGKRILYDRSHGSPPLDNYSQLRDDLINAGATIDVNWYYPVDEAVLAGYDVLWVSCCGYLTWGYNELEAVDHWLRRGGGLLVQGQDSPATAGPASIFGILYFQAACSAGPTSSIAPHPISVDVASVWVNYTCSRLIPSPGSSIVVLDNVGQPHVVAKEANGGRIVVLASEDFIDGVIARDDNRLLATNSVSWLARPVYSNVPWLTVSPLTANIPGHSSQDIVLTFDAANLSAGEYHATLAIEHNDPAQAFPAEVPITFTVHPPTAVTLKGLSAGQAAAPPFVPALPLAAAPAVAAAALALVGWRRRGRQAA